MRPLWEVIAMNVCLMLLTYDRFGYASRTLRSALSRLSMSSNNELSVHIADDGSPEGYREGLIEIAGEYDRVAHVGSSNSERRGYGGNYNLATQAVHGWADLVLPLEDDWELTRPFDLDPLIEALSTEPEFGCIRLGYVGWTQPLRGEFRYAAGYHWLLLDPDSPEPHVFSGGPRLETVAFERRVGLWPEGLEAGQTEFAVAHRRPAREGVVWPVDLVHPLGDAWAHIGTVKAENP
jgi:hypothetical protein